MSSFEQTINEFGQFIIAVKVFAPANSREDYDTVEKTATGYRALVDTGANECGISGKIVADLALRPYSDWDVMTAGEMYTTSAYFVGLSVVAPEIEIHSEKQADESIVIKPVVVGETSKGVSEIQVTMFPDVGIDRSFDMILGMNILEHFHITMWSGKIIISI